jgi:hypothetical protein
MTPGRLHLVRLVLCHRIPKLLIVIHANFLACVQLVVAAEIHVLLEKRDDIGIECLPIWVLEVVPVAELADALKVSRSYTHFWLLS